MSVPVFAQPPRFEVASIKMRPPNSLITAVGGAPSGSRLVLEAMSLSDLISWAYKVKPAQVAGGPPWTGIQRDRTTLDSATKRFDVVAKADDAPPPSIEGFRRMLRTLLAERFKLVLHEESRDTSVYALVVDKKGPKIVESSIDAKGILRMAGKGRIIGSGATMAQLTGWFSNANGVDRPVLDETGLTGHYDFTIEWSNPLNGENDSSGPSIFTAITEQLGLRFKPLHAPMTVLAVDHAELPGDN